MCLVKIKEGSFVLLENDEHRTRVVLLMKHTEDYIHGWISLSKGRAIITCLLSYLPLSFSLHFLVHFFFFFLSPFIFHLLSFRSSLSPSPFLHSAWSLTPFLSLSLSLSLSVGVQTRHSVQSTQHDAARVYGVSCRLTTGKPPVADEGETGTMKRSCWRVVGRDVEKQRERERERESESERGGG